MYDMTVHSLLQHFQRKMKEIHYAVMLQNIRIFCRLIYTYIYEVFIKSMIFSTFGTCQGS